LALHTGPLRNALHTLKYRENTPLSQAFAQLMAQHWPLPFPADAVLMPVPLSSERMRERGFNQAEVLAWELGAERNLPVAANVVRRVKHTRSQVGLSGAERIDNVAGAFAVDTDSAQDLSVIIIDDVCTTGATLGACANALLQGGAKQVWAYTLTRACRDDADTLN
jgi:ComF family protein